MQPCVNPYTRAHSRVYADFLHAYTSARLRCCRIFPESQRRKWEVVVQGGRKGRGGVAARRPEEKRREEEGW